MPVLIRNLYSLLLLAALCLPQTVFAQPWESLNPQQKEALAPLAGTWGTLSETQPAQAATFAFPP